MDSFQFGELFELLRRKCAGNKYPPPGSFTYEDITDCLEKKFLSKNYFTSLGPNCMLSLNPYLHRDFDSTKFSPAEMDIYLQPNFQNESKTLPPHIFQLARNLYTAMLMTGQDQTVFFSGEAGSGKTTLGRHLLAQLIRLNQKVKMNENKSDLKLRNQILASQYVFQLFAHAKVQSGNNASRHSLLTEVHYDGLGKMVGVQYSSYGFERSRVANCRNPDRNFHVFYALLAAPLPEEKSAWKLGDQSKFSYLNKGSKRSVGLDDAKMMNDLRLALKVLGLSTAYQSHIFQILAAILHLGNIEFQDLSRKGMRSHQDHNAATQVRNTDSLVLAANLLGIEPQSLLSALTFQTQVYRGDTVTIFLDAHQAEDCRDKLAQTIYSLLFSWLVRYMNSALMMRAVSPRDETNNDISSINNVNNAATRSFTIINLLDLAGYEAVNVNSFEQFLINYQNEKQQSIVIKGYNDLLVEYKREGLLTAEMVVPLPSNQATVKFYEDPINGAFQILEEHTSNNFGHSTADKEASGDVPFVEDLRRANAALNSPLPAFIPSIPGNNPLSFGLRHYFGTTAYAPSTGTESGSFVARNDQHVGPDFLALIYGGYGASPCSNSFLAKLFSAGGDVQSVLLNGKNAKNDICDAYLHENARFPTRLQPCDSRTNTLMSRKSIFNPNETIRKRKPMMKKIEKESEGSGNALLARCVSTELLGEIQELFNSLVHSSNIQHVICIKPHQSKSGINDFGKKSSIPDLTFDKIRVLNQLKANHVLDWVCCLGLSPFPARFSYSDLIRITRSMVKITTNFSKNTPGEPVSIIESVPPNDLADTHANREWMRDYLWIEKGLADRLCSEDFTFTPTFVYMSGRAYHVIINLLNETALRRENPEKLLEVDVLRHPKQSQTQQTKVETVASPDQYLERRVRTNYSSDKRAKGSSNYGKISEDPSDPVVFLKDATSSFEDIPACDKPTNMLPNNGQSFQYPNYASKKEADALKDLASKNVFPEEEDVAEKSLSRQRRIWLIIVRLCTWYVPSSLLYACGMKSPEMQSAWREKLTLCAIIFMLSAFLFFYIIGLSRILCPSQKIMNNMELARKPSTQPHVIIRGKVFDLTKFLPNHVGGDATSEEISALNGMDVSHLFPVAKRCRLSALPPDSEGSDQAYSFIADQRPSMNSELSSLLLNDAQKKPKQVKIKIKNDNKVPNPSEATPVSNNVHNLDDNENVSLSNEKNLDNAISVASDLLDSMQISNSANIEHLNNDLSTHDDVNMNENEEKIHKKEKISNETKQKKARKNKFVADDEPFDSYISDPEIDLYNEESYKPKEFYPSPEVLFEQQDQNEDNQTDIDNETCSARGFSFCHREPYMYAILEQYCIGEYGLSTDQLLLGNSKYNALIAIHGAVYNITTLVRQWNGTLSQGGRTYLLSPPWGQDKTDQLSKYPTSSHDLYCLGDYQIGIMDNRHSFRCTLADMILIGSTALVVAVMAFKFLAALQLGSPRDPEDLDKYVVLLVPCYTEGEESLRQTIDSLACLKYDDNRKLLFIVADGMVVGSGNDRSTPEIVLDILGVDRSEESGFEDPPSLPFRSIGEGMKACNAGKVYSGLYETSGHRVPYLVIVKTGNMLERTKPGNRGKRDSQLVLLRFLAAIHSNSLMSPLELEIAKALRLTLGVHPGYYEYVMMVDADTQVQPDALTRMVACLTHDARVMGICGETQIANERDSWVTMIQVYEYYISHHLAKAFESLFGSVTCLPGCFCVYRIKSPGKGSPLLIHPGVLEDYAQCHVDTLHKKNLLSLGEDRYLTTLMLRYFPTRRMTFTPDAVCRTTAPDRWSVLLSQRRRWINSTIHNLFELLLLPQLCGCACFSMRFVVTMDLFATLVMPATIAYLMILIYQAFSSQLIPVISLCMLAAVYGMQIIIFILKRQWQYIGWMIIYILALPLFGLFIPLYAFWHFDDFSWGNTRRVEGKKFANANKESVGLIENSAGICDPSQIPLLKWDEKLQLLEADRVAKSHSAVTINIGNGASNSPSSISAIETSSKKTIPMTSLSSSIASDPFNPAYPNPSTPSIKSCHHSQPNLRHYGKHNLNDTQHAPYHNGSASSVIILPYTPNHNDGYPSANVFDHSHNPGALVPFRPARNNKLPSQALRQSTPHSPHHAHNSTSTTTSCVFPSDEILITVTRDILSNADLSTVTKKSIRSELASRFGAGINLDSKKEFINSIIELILKNQL